MEAARRGRTIAGVAAPAFRPMATLSRRALVHEHAGRTFDQPLDRPGRYRVELWLVIADQPRPWILSNPFYVVDDRRGPLRGPTPLRNPFHLIETNQPLFFGLTQLPSRPVRAVMEAEGVGVGCGHELGVEFLLLLVEFGDGAFEVGHFCGDLSHCGAGRNARRGGGVGGARFGETLGLRFAPLHDLC